MYAGQSIELLIGGDAGYYIDITPLKASTHELRITAGWDIPKDRLVTIRAGKQDAPTGAWAVHHRHGPARSAQYREESQPGSTKLANW